MRELKLETKVAVEALSPKCIQALCPLLRIDTFHKTRRWFTARTLLGMCL
jgi:hypothetical protein